jgi:hypothetical protein
MNKHNSQNSMIRWALIIAAALLAFWIVRTVYYRLASRAPVSSTALTTTSTSKTAAPVATTQAQTQVAPAAATAKEPENKEVSDTIFCT